MDNRKQKFFHGAMILGIALLLVKIIGMFYKIPLIRLLDDAGMGYFGQAYQIYTLMFAVATAGFPVAVSKMVAEASARGDDKEADKVFYISLFILCGIGLLGAGIIYFFADQIVMLTGHGGAKLGMLAIAPAVFFVSVAAAFRGYFQGKQNMYPTAFSEVIEALGKLFIGYFTAAYLIQFSLEQASAGAVFGVTCGTLLSMVMLIVVYLSIHKKPERAIGSTRSFTTLAKKLLIITIPVTIGASVSSLTNVADLFTVINRLQVGGVSAEVANALYGAYSGSAGTMFNMPLTIVSALSMSIVPAIAGAMEIKQKLNARRLTGFALRVTVLFALPATVGLSLLAQPILDVVLNKGDNAYLLEKLAIAVIFVSIVSVTTAILQAYGKMKLPLINMTIGGVIKVILNYILIPVYGIEAAPISTCICYFTISIMNIVWVIKVSGVELKLWDFYLKPIVATLAMLVSILFMNNVMYGKSAILQLLASGGVGSAIYFIMLFVVRAFSKEDIESLPFGKKIAPILIKINLLRD